MKKSAVIFIFTVGTIWFSRHQLLKGWLMITNKWTRFDSLFNHYGKKYGVPAETLKAIAMNESLLGTERSVARGLLNPKDVEGSKSSDGKSWGIMQVTLKTAQGIDAKATPEKLNDPAYSIDLAAQYIAQLMRQFSKNDPRYWEYVVKSYNQGPGNTKDREIEGREQLNPKVVEYFDRYKRNLTQVKEGQQNV